MNTTAQNRIEQESVEDRDARLGDTGNLLHKTTPGTYVYALDYIT